MATSFYETIATDRGGDAIELQDCIRRTVDQLIVEETSSQRPGILLGKIQSGKTRAFLGVMALAFDKGSDVAVVLTKGTVSLARQTLNRIKKDFRSFCSGDNDDVLVFDIMALPSLTGYELGKKLIFVVKKEDDNMRRLIEAFDQYPELKNRRILIVDDEADLASVSFQRAKGGVAKVGVVSSQIDNLRKSVKSFAFLQVTATPYSLYLQPEDDMLKPDGSLLFLPKRPKFTEILPIHPDYVGGDYYFEKSAEEGSPAFYFYKPVPLAERDALKEEDGRRLKLENVLTVKNTEVLRQAIMDFIVGASIRRIQQKEAGQKEQKYSFLFHTESARKSHAWQEKVVTEIHDQLVKRCQDNDPLFEEMLKKAYENLKPSVIASGLLMPTFGMCEAAVRTAIKNKHLMITKVNSEAAVDALLDEEGQLKLRTPMNIFIGGQILDRGITIGNMIGFYYGRNPRRFQQDTVLQHSRMYGARPKSDLGVTRFYAPPNIYSLMRRIHEFDCALREAFVSGAHDRGVYFIQKDIAQNLGPCSPNKIMFSSVTSVRPSSRMVPIHFQTVAKSHGKKNLQKLDDLVMSALGPKMTGGKLIDLGSAVHMLEKAFDNLEFDEDALLDARPFLAVLEHLSKASKGEFQEHVFLLAATDRNVVRIRKSGRFSDAPDTKQQSDEAQMRAQKVPVLMLLRQNGQEEDGWRGLPFWWPLIVVPANAVTCVFAGQSINADSDDPDGVSKGQ